MEVLTQNDYFLAVVVNALRDRKDEYAPLDQATSGFLEFFRHQREEEELRRLVDMADKMDEAGIEVLPPEELKKLSDIFLELPKDGWELLERQANAH